MFDNPQNRSRPSATALHLLWSRAGTSEAIVTATPFPNLSPIFLS